MGHWEHAATQDRPDLLAVELHLPALAIGLDLLVITIEIFLVVHFTVGGSFFVAVLPSAEDLIMEGIRAVLKVKDLDKLVMLRANIGHREGEMSKGVDMELVGIKHRSRWVIFACP